jgi:2-(3-amino-3-carboxypropyl)histidine synthase
MYDFHFDDIAKFVTRKGARTVVLQMPEGLKVYAQQIATEVESRTKAKCLILGDPCYGACDLYSDYRNLGDVLVHIGHAEIPSMNIGERVLFIEVGFDFNVIDLLERAEPNLKDRIGIFTTIQHIDQIPEATRWLLEHGKTVKVGMGDGRLKREGQVLGCNVTAATNIDHEVEQYLYIGSGDFHPLEVAIETNKQVIVLDPIMNEVRELKGLKEKILRQRHGAIARCHDAKDFLIIVSSKMGQNRLSMALDINDKLRGKGLVSGIIVMNEVRPDYLLPYHADVYVSTACPRLAIDDYLRYPKPIITPTELEIVLGERSWEQYRMDTILG